MERLARTFIFALVSLFVAMGTLPLDLFAAEGPGRRFPQPAPGPVSPPPGVRSLVNPFEGLSRPQRYSASRESSYQRQGGPRDNFWIPTTGEEVPLADIAGPGAITHIWTTHRGDGRDLVIRIYWDGSEHPSVEAPIGDFFGVAMGVSAVMNSAPIQVSSDGRSRNCWWHMPFNKSARVTAAATRSANNAERSTVPLYFYIDYRVVAEPIDDICYFHARFTETDPPVRGVPVTLLEAEGHGHFVGVVLGHRARMEGWFGEGDDIITVDGKVSFLGTGTEDYFCDAWGFRVFSYPYHGAPVVEGREVGDCLSVYRFHILDPIPFRRSFKLEIEHWPWISVLPNTGRGYYSSTGFWYQATIHAPWPRLERIVSNGPWDPDKGRWHVEGAIEAEDLEVLGSKSKAGPEAKPTVQRLLPNLSGDHLLFFDSGGEGELSLALPVEKGGLYTLHVYLVRALDYGIVELSVNEGPLGAPVDTFQKKDDLTRPIWPPKRLDYPDVPLVEGRNTLRLSVTSKSPESEGFRLGLDCLVLERQAAP
jgi:hypothetical protein